jgi:hypothetical protein
MFDYILYGATIMYESINVLVGDPSAHNGKQGVELLSMQGMAAIGTPDCHSCILTFAAGWFGHSDDDVVHAGVDKSSHRHHVG